MALTLNREYEMDFGVTDHAAVVGHLRHVLNSLAAKPQYSIFYIGITGNLEQRRASHARSKPQYRMMCPIYEEQNIIVSNSFHNLERDAINRFRQGIKHPTTGQVLLRCGNGPGGSQAKNWLYVLVG